jgi:hypothetical protein
MVWGFLILTQYTEEEIFTAHASDEGNVLLQWFV